MRDIFYRDTWVEVDLDAINNNISQLKCRLAGGSKLIAVVKANGYGHGALQIAKTALSSGADSLAVAFLDEAISLRKNGIEAPILVLGASRASDVEVAYEYNITLTVFQLEWIEEALSLLAENTFMPIHLKLDTGMGRLGFRTEEDLRKVEDLLMKQSKIKVEGVFTHFATADEKNTTYLEKQIARFRELLNVFSELPEVIHCSNSAAGLLHSELQYNAVRLGISMYGLTPSLEIEEDLPYPLKEAFSLHSKLVHVKKLKQGDKVSYGATYVAEEEQWIGTIPIGYADGWLRRLQGQEVLVEGVRVPIVGRICMDQCMVRLPYEMKSGTKVTLIGNQERLKITVNEVATKLETINYEITCMISSRVPRVYRANGEYKEIANPLLE